MTTLDARKISQADDLDYNMILSVPIALGKRIQKHLTAEEDTGLRLELQTKMNMQNKYDSRKMALKIDNTTLPITILDIPCVIEAKKTIDTKVFYKSGDIAQMLYVHDERFKLNSVDDLTKFNPLEINGF